MPRLRAPQKQLMSSVKEQRVSSTFVSRVFSQPTLQASSMHSKHFCGLGNIPLVLCQYAMHVLSFNFCQGRKLTVRAVLGILWKKTRQY